MRSKLLLGVMARLMCFAGLAMGANGPGQEDANDHSQWERGLVQRIKSRCDGQLLLEPWYMPNAAQASDLIRFARRFNNENDLNSAIEEDIIRREPYSEEDVEGGDFGELGECADEKRREFINTMNDYLVKEERRTRYRLLAAFLQGFSTLLDMDKNGKLEGLSISKKDTLLISYALRKIDMLKGENYLELSNEARKNVQKWVFKKSLENISSFFSEKLDISEDNVFDLFNSVRQIKQDSQSYAAFRDAILEKFDTVRNTLSPVMDSGDLYRILMRTLIRSSDLWLSALENNPDTVLIEYMVNGYGIDTSKGIVDAIIACGNDSKLKRLVCLIFAPNTEKREKVEQAANEIADFLRAGKVTLEQSKILDLFKQVQTIESNNIELEHRLYLGYCHSYSALMLTLIPHVDVWYSELKAEDKVWIRELLDNLGIDTTGSKSKALLACKSDGHYKKLVNFVMG